MIFINGGMDKQMCSKPSNEKGIKKTSSRLKRSYVVWFYLYEISRIGKSMDREQFHGGQGLGEGGYAYAIFFWMMGVFWKLIEMVIS